MTSIPSSLAARPSRRRRFNLQTALAVGLGAGVIATVIQIVLWWLAGMPLPETLFRDARLTAALAMGTAILPPPATARWDILLVASLIHFVLSFAYALIPAYWVGRLRAIPALPAGALYGLAIYVVNLYGLTAFFPWFTASRDWVTLVTHLVFGIVLAEGCRLFALEARDADIAAAIAAKS